MTLYANVTTPCETVCPGLFFGKTKIASLGCPDVILFGLFTQCTSELAFTIPECRRSYQPILNSIAIGLGILFSCIIILICYLAYRYHWITRILSFFRFLLDFGHGRNNTNITSNSIPATASINNNAQPTVSQPQLNYRHEARATFHPNKPNPITLFVILGCFVSLSTAESPCDQTIYQKSTMSSCDDTGCQNTDTVFFSLHPSQTTCF